MQIIKNKSYFTVSDKDYKFWQRYMHTDWEQDFFNYVNNTKFLKYNFIDVGAAVGAMSLYAASKFKLVISLEPDITAFEILKKNVNLNRNKFDNIKLLNKFLSTKNEKSRFISGPIFGASHFVTKKAGNFLCYGITLKKILKKFNNNKFFLKIDIEGYEFSLLKNLEFQNIIRKYKPPIYLAIHLGANFDLKYKISKINFFQRFMNLDKTFHEYKLLYKLLKNYEYIKINNKLVSKLFFLRLKYYRKDVEIFAYN
tara:strand:- start:4240 stop:5004 length:765 start_codon:yes stop_codon:yes gene_type:complete